MPSAIMAMVLSPPLPAARALKVESIPVTVPSRPTRGAALTAIFISFRSRTKGSISRARISPKAALASTLSAPVRRATSSKSSPTAPRRSSGSWIQRRQVASVIRESPWNEVDQDAEPEGEDEQGDRTARAIIAQPPFETRSPRPSRRGRRGPRSRPDRAGGSGCWIFKPRRRARAGGVCRLGATSSFSTSVVALLYAGRACPEDTGHLPADRVLRRRPATAPRRASAGSPNSSDMATSLAKRTAADSIFVMIAARLAREVGVQQQRGDRDDQAELRRDQRLGDTAGELLHVAGSEDGDLLEGVDDARDGAEEAEQRRGRRADRDEGQRPSGAWSWRRGPSRTSPPP